MFFLKKWLPAHFDPCDECTQFDVGLIFVMSIFSANSVELLELLVFNFDSCGVE